MNDFDPITVDDVETADDLIEFIRSRFGVVVTWKEKAKFKNMLKQFKSDNPHVDIGVLAKAADWAKKGHKKATSLCAVFYYVDFARKAGALPELDPKHVENVELEDRITEALEVEKDEGWRRRLIASSGSARILAITEWQEQRGMAVA